LKYKRILPYRKGKAVNLRRHRNTAEQGCSHIHTQRCVAAGTVRALVLLALQLFCFKRYFDPLFVHNHDSKAT